MGMYVDCPRRPLAPYLALHRTLNRDALLPVTTRTIRARMPKISARRSQGEVPEASLCQGLHWDGSSVARTLELDAAPPSHRAVGGSRDLRGMGEKRCGNMSECRKSQHGCLCLTHPPKNLAASVIAYFPSPLPQFEVSLEVR